MSNLNLKELCESLTGLKKELKIGNKLEPCLWDNILVVFKDFNCYLYYPDKLFLDLGTEFFKPCNFKDFKFLVHLGVLHKLISKNLFNSTNKVESRNNNLVIHVDEFTEFELYSSTHYLESGRFMEFDVYLDGLCLASKESSYDYTPSFLIGKELISEIKKCKQTQKGGNCLAYLGIDFHNNQYVLISYSKTEVYWSNDCDITSLVWLDLKDIKLDCESRLYLHGLLKTKSNATEVTLTNHIPDLVNSLLDIVLEVSTNQVFLKNTQAEYTLVSSEFSKFKDFIKLLESNKEYEIALKFSKDKIELCSSQTGSSIFIDCVLSDNYFIPEKQRYSVSSLSVLIKKLNKTTKRDSFVFSFSPFNKHESLLLFSVTHKDLVLVSTPCLRK